MAPTRGSNLPVCEERQWSGEASSDVQKELHRSNSENVALVNRPATLVANSTKENDDHQVFAYGSAIHPKKIYLESEPLEQNLLEQVSKNDIQLSHNFGAPSCLNHGDEFAVALPEKSLGKGKKRKKRQCSHKMLSKRHKAIIPIPVMSLDELHITDSPSKVLEKDKINGKSFGRHSHVAHNDGKNDTNNKNVQMSSKPPAINAVSTSKVHGGTTRGSRGCGDNGDSDDGHRKPPWKPPDNVPTENTKQVREPTLESKICLMLNCQINHYNFHGKPEDCGKCRRVETSLMRHYFDEKNRQCACNQCLIWTDVLKYHVKCCQINNCKICERTKLVPVKESPVVYTQPTIPKPFVPSLDKDDLIVWKSETVPGDVMHFKDYIMSGDFLDKGGHGSIHKISISYENQLKYFKKDVNIVVKKTDTMGEDEKQMLFHTTKHQNLVATYLVTQKTSPSKHYLIFMEKCDMSLKSYMKALLQKGKELQFHEAMYYWTQIMDVIKFLHFLRIPIIHRDIKAENVLLCIEDNLVRAKLADYDTVKLLHNEFTQPGLVAKGTHGFVSPEVQRQLPHGRPADIYNANMFLLQIIFPKKFFEMQKAIKDLNFNYNWHDAIEHITKDFVDLAITELSKLDSDLAFLVTRCLDKEPEKRPTAAEVLKDKAFVKYSNQQMKMDEIVEFFNSMKMSSD